MGICIQILEEHNLFNIFSWRDTLHDKFHNRFHDRFHDKQTPPNNSLRFIEFETYNIKSNPPLIFRQQSMQWSRNMVHSHSTLCLRTRDYIKRLSQHPWFGLWMRIKGPHHSKVTTLGSCVKWPLGIHNLTCCCCCQTLPTHKPSSWKLIPCRPCAIMYEKTKGGVSVTRTSL